MELDELRDIWKEDKKKFEDRIRLNEDRLKKMNMDKAVSEFDKLLTRSILGRNLTLVYCVGTLVLASFMIEEIQYSVPAILGALLMLWSFVHHMTIEKPDYNHMSLLELQKSICKFRIHTSSSSRYDIGITILWNLAATPLFLGELLHIHVYESAKSLIIFCLYALVFVVFLIAYGKRIYAQYEQKLQRSESYLDEIMDFEKTELKEKDNLTS